jgi:integral membrane protein (TIGR01906 family)
MRSSSLTRAFSWVVTLLVPVILTLTAVRLLFTPLFLRFEYNLPGFPEDRYGFTTQERIYWAQFAMEYLLNPDGIEYLADLQFEDGTPLYNERELRHMVDVKNTVKAVFWVLTLSLIILAGLAVWAWLGKWWNGYANGVRRGGWLAVILVGSLIIFSILSFGVFFTAFHNVFFEPGTWQFLWSDTLIRLFPQRFWQDIFIYVGLAVVLSGLALGIGLRRYASPGKGSD